MKIDFNYKFVNLDGTVIPERPPEMEEVNGKQVEKKSPPFTLRTACVNVLVMREMEKRGERAKELTGNEKVKRYELAKKIFKSTGLVDLEAEQVTLLKELIGNIYPPITVGQAFEILDPHSVDEKK